VISDAFRIAQSGRPGPVWIDIPKDVQAATIELETLPEPGERAPAPAFAPESVREAAAMINAAKRPVLYLGGGVINAPQIRELAEKANLPTTMTLMALGMLPKASAVAGDAGDARRAQHQLHSAGSGFTDCFRRAF
jgi:acetolactate synthase-1/2/3 large subunit